MNKYLSYENKIILKLNKKLNKYHCSIQLVNKLNANACIIKFDDKYLIFVLDNLDKRLLPITLFHEIGHIHFKTIRSNPKKNNYFIELLSNLYAINRLSFIFPVLKRIKLVILAFLSEKKLYKYFIENTKVKGKLLYEQISKN